MKRIYRENELREIVGKPYIDMLDLWTTTTIESIGHSIEILALNRRDNPMFANFDGLMNSAMPEVINGEIKLIAYLETIEPIDYQLLTHEIGHWILNLREFQVVRFKEDSFTGSLINSLSQHRALYKLQRSMNIDPQNCVDERAQSYISLFSKDESDSFNSRITHPLLLSDVLLSCSASLGAELNEIIAKKYLTTKKWTDTIMETASYYDLYNPEGCLKFVKMVFKKLKLGNNWKVLNNLSELRLLSKELCTRNK